MEALKVNDTLFKGSHSTEDLLKYYNNWAQTGKYDEVRQKMITVTHSMINL